MPDANSLRGVVVVQFEESLSFTKQLLMLQTHELSWIKVP
jgi:hypothetical protein